MGGGLQNMRVQTRRLWSDGCVGCLLLHTCHQRSYMDYQYVMVHVGSVCCAGRLQSAANHGCPSISTACFEVMR